MVMNKSPSPVCQFPAVPLGIARSALFGVGRHGRMQILHRQPIAILALRGAQLTYIGPKLTQHHALLWQAVIQVATDLSVNDDQPFAVAADVLLRAMGGQGNDTKQRQRIWEWLKDLTHAQIEYSTDTHDYAGPLVFEVARDKVKQKLALRLNPNLISLLSNEVLRNDLARKASLGRNMLAMWLHDYIATHLRPPAEEVEALRQRCGSTLALPQFRQRLRSAMQVLSKGKDPLVLSWSIDNRDRLTVKKTATRVVILPSEVAQAKSAGARQAARQWNDIEGARKRRAKVAL